MEWGTRLDNLKNEKGKGVYCLKKQVLTIICSVAISIMVLREGLKGACNLTGFGSI